METILSQEQKQIQKLSPVMRQSLEILQMPTLDLADLIKKEALKNPTIEIAEPRENITAHDGERSNAHQEFLENVESEIPLEEHLMCQIPDWPHKKKEILSKLLESLDERGFFEGNFQKIAEQTNTTLEDVVFVYTELQKLDPIGLGTENLQQFLFLQLNNKKSDKNVELAKILVLHYFTDLQAGKIDFICKKLNKMRQEVIEAGRLIARLNFSPISGFSNKKTESIVADLKIFKKDDEWVIDMRSDLIPVIRFSKLYKDIAVKSCDVDKTTWKYLRKQARSGKLLYTAVERRQNTLLQIAKSVLARQIDFFENGQKFMRPLRLKDVADDINLHVSTISRAIGGKYVDTPHGIVPMSKFFDSGDTNKSIVSQGAILERIWEIINSNKEKLTDAEISEILKNSGINIARRTVAKYRSLANIPNSKMRI